MIMVEDSKGLSFKCKQETMNGFNGTIPMVIKRVNENKTYDESENKLVFHTNVLRVTWDIV